MTRHHWRHVVVVGWEQDLGCYGRGERRLWVYIRLMQEGIAEEEGWEVVDDDGGDGGVG